MEEQLKSRLKHKYLGRTYRVRKFLTQDRSTFWSLDKRVCLYPTKRKVYNNEFPYNVLLSFFNSYQELLGEEPLVE